MDTLTRIKSFIAVVDAGSFSAAARNGGRSKALISKYVRELEDELGVRLLNRSTRTLSLTEIGRDYYNDAQDLVQKFEALQSGVRDQQNGPGGKLKISAPLDFGDDRLISGIMRFVKDNPDVELDLTLENRFVNVIDEGHDLVIRASTIGDTSMIARRLSGLRIVTCAAPELLAKTGVPATPYELSGMPCIADTNLKNWNNWQFEIDGQLKSVTVSGSVIVNEPNAALAAAVEGLGFVRTPYQLAAPLMATGKLQIVLEEFETNSASVVAMYPHRRYLSATVRALIDHLANWYKKAPEHG